MIDIEFVQQVAREAGQRAVALQASLRPELKADNSYVTEIDRSTERFVRERLEEKYPDFGFIGEEYGRHGDPDAPLWAVDPIDGTTNMVFGVPFWCVSIGLIVGGEPVAGALYAPRTDEMFYGVKGQGGYCNGVRLSATDREELHIEDTLGFTSSAVRYLPIDRVTGRIRCMGSIALDIAYTARGSYCSLVGWREGVYDMAAALCVAYEAGCVALHLNGDIFDIERMVREIKSHTSFVIAPPKLAKLLQQELGEKRETESRTAP